LWSAWVGGIRDWKFCTASVKHRRVAKQFDLALARGRLFTVASRLADQTGIDLVTRAHDDIFTVGGQLVIMGQGEHHRESEVRDLVEHLPDKSTQECFRRRSGPERLRGKRFFVDAKTHPTDARAD
jgi:glycogen synthase